MDDTYAREEPVTSWPVDDPRWQVYNRGWREGYAAAQADAVGRLDPALLDARVVERFGALLADLRMREQAGGIFS
jgi:hypothetical protein